MTIVTVAGATVTVSAVTVIVAIADLPSLVAVITVLPTATPVITPVDDTVPTAGLELPHVTARPVNVLFPASRTVAVRT
jgi:hypothetical protein